MSFTPFDDPSTPEASDPVFGSRSVQVWDGAGVGTPMVLTAASGLEAFYLGFEGPETTLDRVVRIGYARSSDGVAWQRFADNPILELAEQTSASGNLGYPWLAGVKVGDEYYVYHAIDAGASGIGLVRISVSDE